MSLDNGDGAKGYYPAKDPEGVPYTWERLKRMLETANKMAKDCVFLEFYLTAMLCSKTSSEAQNLVSLLIEFATEVLYQAAILARNTGMEYSVVNQNFKKGKNVKL